MPPPSNLHCPSCGAEITDVKSPYCPKCLQIVNRDIVEKKVVEKKDMNVSGLLMKFEGLSGQIELYKDKIIIKREGFIPKIGHGFTKGDKTIYLNHITGIQLRLAGFFIPGYFQFTLPGGIESTKGFMDARLDENSVTFDRPEQNDSAKQLKQKIEELIQKSRQSTNQIVQVSSADELRKFKQLLDEGIITKDEFDRKKKELLGL